MARGLSGNDHCWVQYNRQRGRLQAVCSYALCEQHAVCVARHLQPPHHAPTLPCTPLQTPHTPHTLSRARACCSSLFSLAPWRSRRSSSSIILRRLSLC